MEFISRSLSILMLKKFTLSKDNTIYTYILEIPTYSCSLRIMKIPVDDKYFEPHAIVSYNWCVCVRNSANLRCAYPTYLNRSTFANAVVRTLGIPNDLCMHEHLRVSSRKDIYLLSINSLPVYPDMLHVLLASDNLTAWYMWLILVLFVKDSEIIKSSSKNQDQ